MNFTNEGRDTALATTGVRTPGGTPDAGSISINLAVGSNIRKLVLEGNSWTVGDVLKYAGVDDKGYQIRIGGQPGDKGSPVTDRQTVFLLNPIRGNRGNIEDVWF